MYTALCRLAGVSCCVGSWICCVGGHKVFKLGGGGVPLLQQPEKLNEHRNACKQQR